MERWNPPVELSKKEQLIMKRLNRVRALFGFLRTKRHILFDDRVRCRRASHACEPENANRAAPLLMSSHDASSLMP